MPKSNKLPDKIDQDQLQKEVDAVAPGCAIVCKWSGETLIDLWIESDAPVDEKAVMDVVYSHKANKSDFEKVREENQKPKQSQRIKDLEDRVAALEAR